MSLGLALSGGGIKGAVHIGVLDALVEEGIKIDYISGCSSGSIVATLFALGYSPMSILNIFLTHGSHVYDFDKSLSSKIMHMAFTRRLNIKSLVEGKNLENIMNHFCIKGDTVDISQVSIPLAIPTVDIMTGEVIYYLSKNIPYRYEYDDIPTHKTEGKLASIVRASSSIPVLFEPKYLDGRKLADGGIKVNTPVSILKRMGAEKVVSVVFNEEKSMYEDLNVISVTMQAFDIMGQEVNKKEISLSDYVININLEDVSIFDNKKIGYMAKLGYDVTKQNIEKIREVINK